MDAVLLDDEIVALLEKTPLDLDFTLESVASTGREIDGAYARLRRSDEVVRVDHVLRDRRARPVADDLPCGARGLVQTVQRDVATVVHGEGAHARRLGDGRAAGSTAPSSQAMTASGDPTGPERST